MKNGRGRSMKRAKVYQLIVSRNLEKTARKILNDGSNFASSDAGTALSNSIKASAVLAASSLRPFKTPAL
jgi:hypothetical protein